MPRYRVNDTLAQNIGRYRPALSRLNVLPEVVRLLPQLPVVYSQGLRLLGWNSAVSSKRSDISIAYIRCRMGESPALLAGVAVGAWAIMRQHK